MDGFPAFNDFQMSITEETYNEICEQAAMVSGHNATDNINHYVFVTEILHLYHDWLAEQLADLLPKTDKPETE